MKLGVFTVLFSDKKLEDMLGFDAAKGIEAVELGTGGYPGDAHCIVDELLADETMQREFLEKIGSRGLTTSALSCYSNPLHPKNKFQRKPMPCSIKRFYWQVNLVLPSSIRYRHGFVRRGVYLPFLRIHIK
ncbi:hypothetical protein [Neobacillus sp. NPDC093127]|uniref:hypothetical protein n=1 Tax=Neobacillus sp. NPDC093127 TaxID=3364296 RepID=UPI00381E3FD2